MKRVTPAWCAEFKCIAGACRHSCCIGWEIDIDEESLQRYKSLQGTFGERLRENIEWAETPHFRLGDGERCPFLNENGLCDMIIELGESSLCQICTDHPRFYTWLPERTEMGLGLCCEEACRLLLESEDYTGLVSEDCDDDPGDDREGWQEVLEMRGELFSILKEEGSIETRLENMLDALGADMPEYDMGEFIDMLLGFEIMNPAWKMALEALKAQPELMDTVPECMEHDGERLTAYLLYRYYVNRELGDVCGEMPLLFACASIKLLRGFYALTARAKGSLELGDRVEWLRLWSGELEYDDESMEAIEDFLFA